MASGLGLFGKGTAGLCAGPPKMGVHTILGGTSWGPNEKGILLFVVVYS